MTTLDRYFARQLLGALIRTLLTLVGLYIVVNFLTDLRVDVSKFDVPWTVVVRYYAATIPQLIYRMAPLAMLLTALMVLGDAAQHNEVTAALSSGISIRRLTRVPVIMGIVLSVGMFGWDYWVVAPSARAADQLNTNYLRRSKDTGREGVSWANLQGEWTCHILKFNRIALTGEGVYILSIRDDALEQIVARRIYWDETHGEGRGAWMLEDGNWMVFDANLDTLRSNERITQRAAPIVETPNDLFAVEELPETKVISELRADIQRAVARGLPVAEVEVSYYAKFANPFLCFVMVLLAIPFAMRVRRGGVAIGFALSVAIAMAYLVLFGASMAFGQAGRIDPVVAAWSANVVFLCVGLVLYLRTPT